MNQLSVTQINKTRQAQLFIINLNYISNHHLINDQS